MNAELVSIVIPTFNEGNTIDACLDHVLGLSAGRGEVEIVVVDGGSNDSTAARVRERSELMGADRVRFVVAPRRGRARQLNAGARAAKGSVLVFLHADTRLPVDGIPQIGEAIREGADYGWFTVRLASRDLRLRVASRLWSTRSRLLVSSTGDQAQFFRRDFFFDVGAYPPLEVCEDLAILKHARRIGRHVCIDDPVVTSARRWEANGFTRTMLTLWKVRALYHLGVPSDRLAAEWRRLTSGASRRREGAPVADSPHSSPAAPVNSSSETA